MPTQSSQQLKCPHCESALPEPPPGWKWSLPWQCSNCGGLYGVGLGSKGRDSQELSSQERGGELFGIARDLRPLWPLHGWAEARRFGFHAQAKHYVYAICYPSGLPMYVGRGRKFRVCQHAEEALKLPEGQLQEKHREIIRLRDSGEWEWYHFLALVSSEAEAARIERAYVQRWGLRSRGGMLVNRIIPDARDAIEPPDLEGIPLPDTSLAVAETIKDSRRQVYHPELLDGYQGPQREYNCAICRGPCSVPDDLTSKIVQCPHCAHLFLPLVEGWRSRGVREFEEV